MGARFGRTHKFYLDTNSPAEAVQALMSQLKGFREYLMGAKDNGVGFAVFAGKQNLAEDELKHPVGSDDIRIAPMILGSKSGGVFNIILGAVIIAASLVADYFTYGRFGAATNYATYSMGAAMIIGGVVQLLTPMPKGLSARDKPENTPSYTFNGPLNTQA